jgi:hypothetical protein
MSTKSAGVQTIFSMPPASWARFSPTSRPYSGTHGVAAYSPPRNR